MRKLLYTGLLLILSLWLGLPAAQPTLQAAGLEIQHIEYLTICRNETYQYKGHLIAQPGEYYDTLYSVSGKRDSLIQIVVELAPSYLIETRAKLRYGSEYQWAHDGQIYTEAGVYYDNQQSSLGCDSIFRLVLEWQAEYYNILDTTVCENDLPFHWHGKYYYEQTEDADIRHGNDVDSLFELKLHIAKKKYEEQTIWLCGDETFVYQGQVISEGQVSDTLHTYYGCDSVIMMYINRAPTYMYSDTVNLDELDTPLWRGQKITEAGIYQDKHLSVYGCDSIYQLVVYNYPTYTIDTVVHICGGNESFEWRGKEYFETGIYYDRYETVNGRDSIYTLHLFADTVYHTEKYVEICDGQTYDFRGTIIDEKGVYRDTLVSRKGCDSIVTLVVNKVSNYIVPIYVEMCDGDMYNFHGDTITETGIYEKTLYSVGGCDSIERLVINFYAIPHTSEQGIVCPGDTFMWRERILTEQGVYHDTLLNNRGCDSIITLVLNVGNTYHYYDTLHKVEQDTLYWHGQRVVASGTYYDNLKSVTGCDSIYQLEVFTHPTYHFYETATICESEGFYEWQDHKFTQTGVYTIMYRSIWGADSVYTLDFKVNPTQYDTKYFYICRGQSISYKGNYITEPTTFNDTLLTSTGCDSIVTVVVNSLQSYLMETHDQMNAGGTYIWRDRELTQEGVYYDSLTTYLGCDSIYKLTLHFNQVHFYKKDTAICAFDLPFDFNGHQLLYQGGTYYDSLTTYAGVDSVYQLNLTVWDRPFREKQLWGCAGEGIQYRDTVFYEPTVYYDTLLTYHGCDSITRVVTNFTPNYLTRQYKHICEGDTFLWRNKPCYKTGIYTDSLLTEHGCDSVFVLEMTVHQAFFDTTQARLCSSDLPYVWRGNNYYETGLYYDSLLSRYGCDSVFMLDLVVSPDFMQVEYHDICQGDFIVVNGDTVTKSGVFDKTYTTAFGCDSVYRTIVTVKATDTIMQTRTMCQNDTFTWRGQTLTRPNIYTDAIPYDNSRGLQCDSVVFMLDLRIDTAFIESLDTIVCKDSLPFRWRERKFWQDTIVADTFVNQYGCDSIYSLQLKLAKCSDPDTFYLCPEQTVEVRGVVYDTIGRFGIEVGPDTIYRFRILPADTFRIRRDTTLCSSTLPLRLENLTIFPDQLTIGGKVNIIDQRLTTIHGCDSIIEWHIKAYKSDTTVRQVSVCNSDVFLFRGEDVATSGIYYDTLYNINGCDSVIKLIFNRQESQFVDEKIVIHTGGSYPWRGKEYVNQGIYYDTLRYVASGCDSVVYRLTLTVNDGFHQYDTVRRCSNELPYVWYDRPLTETGVYTQNYTNIVGADSVYTLYFFVTKADTTVRQVTVCNSDVYMFRGRPVEKSGVYLDTLYNIHGCDSVIKLVFNRQETMLIDESTTINQGGVYQWRNKKYYTQGVYLDTLRYASTGCDSVIYRLNLTVNETYYKYDTVRLCSNELPYIWFNRPLSTTGIYTQNMTTATGADSIYTLYFYVTKADTTVRQVTVCNDDVYMFRGRPVEKSGVYLDTLYNIHGCDSVIKLVFNRQETMFVDERITVNHGGAYLWHGKNYTDQGVYYDTLRYNTTGCDSIIYRLHLTVNEGFYRYDTVHVCTNQLPYIWFNKPYEQAGRYEQRYTTVSGTDSIYTLILKVDSAYVYTQTYSLCNNEYYNFNGRTIKEPGIYYDTLRSSCDCDSVIRLIINKSYTAFVEQKVRTCAGEPYIFKGKQYTPPCVFYDTLITNYGCDSIIRYILNEYPTYATDRYDTIREGESYLFDGKQIYQHGTYYQRSKTVTGCDSIIRLHLYVMSAAFVEDTVTICYDSPDFPYVHNRKEYRQSTIIKDTMRTIQGYDSVVWTHLIVHPRVPETVLKVTLCNDDELHLLNRVIRTAGNYYDTLLAHTGCDSIIHYVVNHSQTYLYKQEVTACEGQGYTWWGHHNNVVLTSPGIYYDSLRTIGGCDSIFELHLIGKRSFLLDTTILLCYDELPYKHEGRLYYTSETFENVFSTYDTGCDSIRRVRYVVTNKCSEVGVEYKCTNAPFYIGSMRFDTVGTYRVPYWTNGGLDSLYRFNLDTVQPIYEDITAQICSGDTLWFEGKPYHRPGNYPVRFNSQYNCDSVRTLHLTVSRPAINDLTKLTIADYETPFLWRNKKYYDTGIYEDYVYDADNDCVDTTYTLNLTVLTTRRDTTEYTICRGDSVCFSGVWYKDNITVNDTLDYLRYNRSAISQFILHVQDSTLLLSLRMRDDCADANEIVAVPVYSGVRPQTYSLQFIGDMAKRAGFENIEEEPFSGEIHIPMPARYGGEYVNPGEYRCRLTLSNGVCGTVVQETNFTIKYPSWIMEQNWGNVVALLNNAYNGGYRFSGYRWTVVGKPNITSTQPFLQSDYLSPGDTVYVSLAREGEDYVPSCPIVIQEAGTPHPYPILVYPTSAPRQQPQITVETPTNGRCYVYDQTGRLCTETVLSDTKQTLVLPCVSGCYMLVLRMADGYTTTRKIILY
ncbi:MAG: T9SS type A sorting domain-containing protein [Paludibacteraceae bacterium]|nr:T9SS type A sorting domain-containing protein [Paludibacteraceae bacterium]